MNSNQIKYFIRNRIPEAKTYLQRSCASKLNVGELKIAQIKIEILITNRSKLS